MSPGGLKTIRNSLKAFYRTNYQNHNLPLPRDVYDNIQAINEQECKERLIENFRAILNCWILHGNPTNGLGFNDKAKFKLYTQTENWNQLPEKIVEKIKSALKSYGLAT